MKPKTPAQRKREERARKKAAGLRRFEFWLTSHEKQRLSDFLTRLRKQAQPKS